MLNISGYKLALPGFGIKYSGAGTGGESYSLFSKNSGINTPRSCLVLKSFCLNASDSCLVLSYSCLVTKNSGINASRSCLVLKSFCHDAK